MADILIPARHITTGDHIMGMSVYQIFNIPGIDGKALVRREIMLVKPFTTHTVTVTVQEKDLDEIKFPVSERGDKHNPSERNLLLGIETPAPAAPAKPEPIAVYPAGTVMRDVHHFDRSMHVVFHCPLHPEAVYSSKDPYSSSWFSRSPEKECPEDCTTKAADQIVHVDYKPTRDS